MFGYVYITTNLINAKRYIGQHRAAFLDTYLGSGNGVRAAVKKYGRKNFRVDIVAVCASQEAMDETEQRFIAHYEAMTNIGFYNIGQGGSGGGVYSSLSREAQLVRNKRLSVSLTGKKHSDEHRLNSSRAKQGKPRKWKGVSRADYSERRKKEVAEGIRKPPKGNAGNRDFRNKDASKRRMSLQVGRAHQRARDQGGSYRSAAGREQWLSKVESFWTKEQREEQRRRTKLSLAKNGHYNSGAKWFHNPTNPKERRLIKELPPFGWIPGKGPTGKRKRP